MKSDSMSDTDGDTESTIPLGLVLACGVAGVLVDFFDGIRILTDGPHWMGQLDVLSAVLLTVAIGGLVARAHLRHNRTRRSA